jgi:hypothetical protein
VVFQFSERFWQMSIGKQLFSFVEDQHRVMHFIDVSVAFPRPALLVIVPDSNEYRDESNLR